MYTAPALLDMHERSQRAFAAAIQHCSAFSPAQCDREIPGFGYASIRLQVHHVIGAQRYWLGVVEGRMDLDGDAEEHPLLTDLDALRLRVAGAVRTHIERATVEELNTPRVMTTWGNRRRELVPAQVFLRTFTHIHHHLGQVAAMCRLLDRPVGGIDFPLD